MIKKTYKATTEISINVVLANKKNLHISFLPISRNNGSTFTTDNEEIINAIERHYNYGKLFKLHRVEGEEKSIKQTAETTSAPIAKKDAGEETTSTIVEDKGEADVSVEDKNLRKVIVSDYASAKDYLADTFGISRTLMRSQKAIIEQATAHGIEFEGLS